MTKQEIFEFIKDHLKIRVEDVSTPSTCGGEVGGNYGVKVTLLLENPLSGEKEEIDSDECDFS